MKSGFGNNNFSHVYIHDPERNTMSIKSPQITSPSNEIHGEIIHGRIPNAKLARTRRDQRAVCFTARTFVRPFAPLAHARSASQTARSSRASIRNVPHERRASVCGSAAGVALRLRFAIRSPPPSAPLSPLADPRPKPEIRNADEVMNPPTGRWRISDFSNH
jgi:hypothetical protein